MATQTAPFTLPALPYAFNALEPHIDARTMEIHRTKHHNAYVTNANNALAGTALADWPVEQVCRRLKEAPADKMAVVRNNAGGHFNHSLFWEMMAPKGKGGKPGGKLAEAFDAYVKTKRFEWAPEHVNRDHVRGEGHAHLYVDGEKLTRLYGAWYYLKSLTPKAAGKLEINGQNGVRSDPELLGQLRALPGIADVKLTLARPVAPKPQAGE